MNREILCAWLGVADKDWPPDHYALLGLEAGVDDPLRIETCVQERLARLRSYQLSHPEEATEGMNRLAQAYICLTEKLARKSAAQPACTSVLQPIISDDTAVSRNTRVDWQVPTVPTPAPTPMQPAPAAVDALHEVACCREARCGLGTLNRLVDRIDRTRKLLMAWKRAGCYLGKPGRRISRLAEEIDLERRLGGIFEQIHDFPPFLGQPGRAGYRVVAMARLEMTALMFKTLDPQQREHLAHDWQAGYDILLAHRRFLLRRFKTMRREGKLRRVQRAIDTFMDDHPVGTAILVGVVAATCLVFYLFWA